MTALLWVVFALAFAGELVSVARSIWKPWPSKPWLQARRAGNAIRVISQNVGGSTFEGLAELARYEPDVVLLQESIGRDDSKKLAQRLFGDQHVVVWGIDPSVLARGRLLTSHAPLVKGAFFVQAHIELEPGRTVEVVSLRMSPPLVRTDLWNPECWREQMDDRKQRRADLSRLAQRLALIPGERRVIVGGDFNCPAGDAVFRLLRPRLSDSFATAGLGWGNTISNDMPFHRIDQVWISSHFTAAAVVAARSPQSDHRTLICDLIWSKD